MQLNLRVSRSLLPIIAIILSLVACKLPFNESDVPEVEWKVTKVVFNSVPTLQYLTVYITGDEQGGEFYQDFDLRKSLNPDDLVSIPNIALTDHSSSFSNNGFLVQTQEKVTIAEGTEAFFNNDWFYKAETDALFTTRVVAKIRIITQSANIIIQ